MRLNDEKGIALPVALAVMTIALLLVAAAVTAATQTNDFAIRDTKVKAALEAADAGLRAATYRLSMLRPDDAHCVSVPAGGAPVVSSPGTGGQTSGYCQDMAPEPVGTGATYQYWMTPGITTTGCTGFQVISASQRCITAIGTANGVSVRLQTRVAAFAAQPLFVVPGLLGKDGVSVLNNAVVNGAAGSNATINVSHSSVIAGGSGVATVVGPSGNVTTTNGATIVGTQQRNTANFVIDPIDPGTSASNTPAGGNCNPPSDPTIGQTNCDYRITNGRQSNPPLPYDPSSQISWNASTRALLVNGNNGSSITLGGSLYNFCTFTTSNKSVVTVNPATDSNGNTIPTRIYIDSPERIVDGSPACPAGTGTLTIGNGTTFVNTSNNPAAVIFYVYGTTKTTNTVTWNNNGATSYVTIVAPNSSVLLQNNGTFQGAISADTITVTQNATFTWDDREKNLTGRPEGIFFRTAWKQCPTTPTNANDPASGC